MDAENYTNWINEFGTEDHQDAEDEYIPPPSRAHNVIEEARSYQKLIEKYGSQEKVAAKCRVKRATIAQKVRLLSLPAAVQKNIESGLLTANHGRALLKIPEQHRANEAHHLLSRGMSGNNALKWASTRAAELEEKEKDEKPIVVQDHGSMDPNWMYQQETLRQATGCRVQIEPTGGGGGKLLIQAFTQHQFEEIMEKLTR